MGYCRRCGDLLFNDRCKCGGARRESTTKGLFNDNNNEDKWTKRYTASSSSSSKPQSSALSIIDHEFEPSSSLSIPTTILKPLPTRKQQNITEDGELSGVFGSVLSPKDQWNCITCSRKFKQEETIYPHPEAKLDSEFSSVFFCRTCFAESFSKGNCKKCKCAVLTDAPFMIHGEFLWHNDCFNCSYCSIPNDPSSIVIDFGNLPSCESCFNSLAYLNSTKPTSPILSRSELRPTTLRPAPSKWGGPVTPPSRDRDRGLDQGGSKSGDEGDRTNGWRARRERDKSPMVASFDELGERLKGLVNKKIGNAAENKEAEKEKIERRPQPMKRSTWTSSTSTTITTTTTSPEKIKIQSPTLLEAPRTILGDKNSITSTITPRQRTQSDITGTGIAERAARLLSSASKSSSKSNSGTSPIKASFGTPRAIKRSTWTIPSSSNPSTSTTTPNVVKDINLTSSSPLYPQSITTPTTVGLRSNSTQQREKLELSAKTPFNTPTNQQQLQQQQKEKDQPSWFTPKLRPAHTRTQSLPPSPPIFVQQVVIPSNSNSNSNFTSSVFTNSNQQKFSSRPNSPSKITNSSRPTSPLKSHWTTKDLEKEKEKEKETSSIQASTQSQFQSRSISPSKRARGPLPIIPPTPNNTPTSKLPSQTQTQPTTSSTYSSPSWLKPKLAGGGHSRSQSLPPPPMIQLPPGAPKVRNNLVPDTSTIDYTRKAKVEEKQQEVVRTPSLVDRARAEDSLRRPKSIHLAHQPDITVVPRNSATAASNTTTKSATPTTLQPTEKKNVKEAEVEICPTCLQELGYGEFVQLAHTGAIIHRNCFRCGGCKEILEAGSHVEIDGKAWHSHCAPQKVVKSLIKPDGEELVLGSRDGGKLGEEEKCEKCKGSLNSNDYSIQVAKTGKSYHQDCFTCGGCRKAFGSEDNQRSFVDIAGVPYHSTCAPARPIVSNRSRSLNPSPYRSSTSRSPASSPIPRPTKIDIPVPTSTSILSSSPSSIFATTRGPPKNLGGLIICAGCSARGTEKETVVGPLGRRYHPKCLKCGLCNRGLDSESRVGEGGTLRCEACRKSEFRRSYRNTANN